VLSAPGLKEGIMVRTMPAVPLAPEQLQAFRAQVGRLLAGGPPHGEEPDACRAVLRGGETGKAAFEALCMLLEGALADPGLPIDETHIVVALLKALAHGAIEVGAML
jgi:hypothetical protein